MAEPIEMRFGCGLWWTEGSMCYMEDTLAPPGEYDWTVRVLLDAAFLSNYLDHLLLLGRIAVLRTQMRPIVTDRVARSVCRSVCHTSEPANTAESIEMPFEFRTQMGPWNHELDGVQIPIEKGNFEGRNVTL